MPLTLPDRLPAIDLLKKENIFVMGTSRATTQDIRPLRIVVLNLMPIKITTETDLIRVLSNTMQSVSSTLWSVMSTPMFICFNFQTMSWISRQRGRSAGGW